MGEEGEWLCSTVLSVTEHTSDGVLKPTYLGPAPVCLTRAESGDVHPSHMPGDAAGCPARQAAAQMFSEKSRVWHPGVGLTPAGLPRERTGHCHKAGEAAALTIAIPTGRSGWGVGCVLSRNAPVSLGGGCLSQLHLL